MTTHQNSYMCFPALPFTIPSLPNFTEMTGINPTAVLESGDDAELSKWCVVNHIDEATEDTILQIASAIGVPLLGDKATTAFLRMFQNPYAAFAALDNLGSAIHAQDGFQRTIFTICAVSRISTVLWMAFFAIVLVCVYFGCCWPCTLLWTEVFVYCCCPRRKRRRRVRIRIMDPTLAAAVGAPFAESDSLLAPMSDSERARRDKQRLDGPYGEPRARRTKGSAQRQRR